MKTGSPLRRALAGCTPRPLAVVPGTAGSLAVALTLAGCGGAQPPATEPSPSARGATTATSASLAGAGETPAAAATAGPADTSTAAPSSAKSAPPEVAEAAVPPLPRGTRVLHIGDSMAGALGIALNDELRAAGVTPILRYQTASFLPNWAGGREVGLYMLEHDPDLVLVTLGTNEMRMEDPTIRAGVIRKLVSRLGGRPCVWVAPPLWGDIGDTGLLPVIRANCAPCVYLDTTALYPDMPRLPDKTHPTMAARKEWAHRVVGWLARARDPGAPRPWDLKRDTAEALAAGKAP